MSNKNTNQKGIENMITLDEVKESIKKQRDMCISNGLSKDEIEEEFLGVNDIADEIERSGDEFTLEVQDSIEEIKQLRGDTLQDIINEMA